MHYVKLVTVENSAQDLAYDLRCKRLSQFLVLHNGSQKVPSLTVLHHYIEVLLILIELIHARDMWMTNFHQLFQSFHKLIVYLRAYLKRRLPYPLNST
jgi:hypothetical protein